MINLMYVLLMAMLALNVSSDVLNGFTLVDESLTKSTANSSEQNLALYRDFARFMDSPVLVKLYRPRNGLKEIPGVLRGYEDGRVTVEAGKETITFEKSQVALVRLRVEF